MGDIADAMIEAEMNGYAPEDFADYLLDQHFEQEGSRKRKPRRQSIAERYTVRTPETHPVTCEGCKRRFKRPEDQHRHALATGHPARQANN